jgi:AcrR family transcriptional regulator
MSTAETPAGGARRRRDPDRGAKILAAARTLFYERGFHAVSVDEIGEAAGATGAAIYRHFSGKEEILSTLFDEALDQYLVALPDPGEEPRAALDSLVRAHLTFTIAHRELGSLWAHEHRALTGDRERRLARRSRQYVDQWVLVLRRVHPHLAEDDLYAAALAAIGTTTSLVSRPGHEVSAREADVVARMLVAGLLALDTLPERT